MQPSRNAWLVCLIPFFCVNISWLWSSIAGAIPWCFTYLEGCVSISRAARSSDALFFFRATMILSAAMLILFWLQSYHFLKLKAWAKEPVAMMILGITGALFLVLYAVFLGTDGQVYRLMRRYGVIFYFTFTVLAQYLLTRQLWHNRYSVKSAIPLLKAMLGLGLFVLIIGLVSLSATIMLENPEKDYWENVTEWWFALAMTSYFGLVALLWKKLGFQCTYQIHNT